ncbi:transcription factor TFIID [Prochlorococcus sp. AH-736-E15]|nr:transcription factor TFIID [Prochlorococcus sp. AH-736-E15]
MKTAVKPDLKSISFRNSKSYCNVRLKESNLDNNKSYQKLFVVLISLSTILIFQESPRELENICENYNSREMCDVW